MSLYRVLVAHRGLSVGQVVELDNPVLGYVKELDNGIRPAAEPVHLDSDNPSGDLPRKRSKAKSPEVTDVQDRPVSNGGLPDSES